jgi:hypothetical protein
MNGTPESSRGGDVFPPSGADLGTRGAAHASLVNRTHRVVRERARSQSDWKLRLKSLWIPLAVCCALLIVLSVAGWMILAQSDLTPTDIPDASAQMLVFFLWFLPVSGALLAAVWLRKSQSPAGSESLQ